MPGELKDVHVYHRKANGNLRFPYKSPRQVKDRNTVSKEVIKKYFDKHLKSSKGALYGVSPDIRVVQNESDLKNGIDRQLEYAINKLK